VTAVLATVKTALKALATAATPWDVTRFVEVAKELAAAVTVWATAEPRAPANKLDAADATKPVILDKFAPAVSVAAVATLPTDFTIPAAKAALDVAMLTKPAVLLLIAAIIAVAAV
jgi:hypothetical protein